MPDEGMDIFDEDLKLTDAFRKEVLPGWLDDEHKDTKCFDDIVDLPNVFKMAASTKAALGKKLDNVIQRPVEDASDEDRANYKTTLLKELGLPDSVEGYQFKVPTLPEGQVYNKEMEKFFAERFFARGVPKAMAESLAEDFNKYMIEQFTKGQEAIKQQRETDINELRADPNWQGDNIAVNLRLAIKALNEFGSDEVKTKIAEKKLYDNPEQFDEWFQLVGDVASLRVWSNIGTRMYGKGAVLPNEGKTGGELTPEQKAHQDYPASFDERGKPITHGAVPAQTT